MPACYYAEESLAQETFRRLRAEKFTFSNIYFAKAIEFRNDHFKNIVFDNYIVRVLRIP